MNSFNKSTDKRNNKIDGTINSQKLRQEWEMTKSTIDNLNKSIDKLNKNKEKNEYVLKETTKK